MKHNTHLGSNAYPCAMCTSLTPTQAKSIWHVSLYDESIKKQMSEHLKNRSKTGTPPLCAWKLVLIDIMYKWHGKTKLGMKTCQDMCQAMWLWPCTMNELPPTPQNTHNHEQAIRIEFPLGSSVAYHWVVGDVPYAHVTCNN